MLREMPREKGGVVYDGIEVLLVEMGRMRVDYVFGCAGFRLGAVSFWREGGLCQI